MDFGQLQERLLARLRNEMRAGDLTQRRLARATGISQPHIHNILKGIRDLTPATTDRLLHALHWSLLDFVETAELLSVLEWRPHTAGTITELLVLSRRIGPGMAWPAEESRFERFSLPFEALHGIWKPVAARLAADPAMRGLFEGGEIAILDYCPIFAEYLDPQALYLAIQEGEGRVRWLRSARRGIYLLNVETLDRPLDWVLADSNTCFIEARVHLASSLLSRGVPRRSFGRDPTPARRSGAS